MWEKTKEQCFLLILKKNIEHKDKVVFKTQMTS